MQRRLRCKEHLKSVVDRWVRVENWFLSTHLRSVLVLRSDRTLYIYKEADHRCFLGYSMLSTKQTNPVPYLVTRYTEIRRLDKKRLKLIFTCKSVGVDTPGERVTASHINRAINTATMTANTITTIIKVVSEVAILVKKFIEFFPDTYCRYKTI